MRYKFDLDMRSLIKLYITFVRPMLEYCDIIWDSDIQNVENIQLDAARILTGGTKLCSTQKLYNDTCLKTLKNRRDKNKLCQLYKMINNLTPSYLQQLVPQRVQERTRYPLRNVKSFAIPAVRTKYHFNSFLPSTLRQLNQLDQHIKESLSLQAFKYKLYMQHTTPPIYFNIIQIKHHV